LLFSPQTNLNLSFFLQAISCHYASSHVYFIDVEGTTHENLAEEVLEIARRRLGPDAEFKFAV
jgi:phytanoyl-CoA hydroxylase